VPSATPPIAASPDPSSDARQPSPAAPTPARPDRSLSSSGAIAAVHADGSLWLIDTSGRSTLLADAAGSAFGFPTWSPDGTRVTAVRSTPTSATVVVFDLDRTALVLPAAPRVIFDDPTVAPFYLSWTPDGVAVSFLSTEAADISLRIAAADGSGPLEGSGTGTVIGTGSPFYYDWIDSGHLFAHIGSGPEAFLGEIETAGPTMAPGIAGPGTFRVADVSADGRYVGYVRAGNGAEDAIVAAERDGSGEHTLPVVGMAAVDFSPVDGTLAAIGATGAVAAPPGIPLGPLRLVDAASGETRTLLDGLVVSFAWSPDGSTIAAIRLVPAAAGSNVSSASPSVAPAPTGRTEVRLAFVDVATGRIRSEPVVSPGAQYVNGLLTYFDQYALSHRLWAPDSSSILLPQVDPDGMTHIDAFFPDGGEPVSLEGEIGFWSP
jgi:TolB protein